LLAVIAAAVVIVDRVTKIYVERHFGVPYGPRQVVDHVLFLTVTRNAGAAFGLFQNFTLGFLLISPVVVVAILIYYWRLAPSDWSARRRQGLVRVDGRAARPGGRLRAGDRLMCEPPTRTPGGLEAERMDLPIVYEEDALAVVDDTAGLVVHPGPGHPSGTLVHGLLGRGPGWSTIGGTERPGIVHRLDRDTSGLMVVARNDDAHRELARQLQRRIMTLKYRAIVV